MSIATANQIFQNYTKITPRIPVFVWIILRIATLAITAALIYVLASNPVLGLRLFWGIAIPLVPALFVVAPGFWRQICPMAFVNQMPRIGGFSLARTLPLTLSNIAFPVAVGAFFVTVAARATFLNHNGPAVAAVIILLLGLALAGGRSIGLLRRLLVRG